MRRVVTCAAIAAALLFWGGPIASKRAAAAPVIPIGTLMVSIGNGLVQEWDTSATPPTFVALLDTGKVGFTAGSVFDVTGDFFVTDFDAQAVSKFDPRVR